MDGARRFLKSLENAFGRVASFKPSLSLPRRRISDNTPLQLIKDAADIVFDKWVELIEKGLRELRQFWRRQKAQDWEGRLHKVADTILLWLAHPRVPRHLGLVLTGMLMVYSLLAGIYYGNHRAAIAVGFESFKNDIVNVAGYKLDDMKITGATYLTPHDIRLILDLKDNQSLLLFNAEDARKKLLQEPWIADVQLVKSLPNKLHISLTERKPIALWQFEKKIVVIGSDGVILLRELREEFRHLPFLVGKNANSEANGFLNALEVYPQLKEQMRAAVLVSERNWRIIMKSGLEIKLPEKDMGLALRDLMNQEKATGLFSKDIVSIDLRMRDKMIVRMTESATLAKIELLNNRAAVKKDKQI